MNRTEQKEFFAKVKAQMTAAQERLNHISTLIPDFEILERLKGELRWIDYILSLAVWCSAETEDDVYSRELQQIMIPVQQSFARLIIQQNNFLYPESPIRVKGIYIAGADEWKCVSN